jgi:cell division protein FtsW
MTRLSMLLAVCVVALLSLGLVMLYSVSPPQESARLLSRQLLAAALGLGGAMVVVLAGYRRLRPLAWWLFALALVLLVAVLVIGVRVNGARRWFRFAGLQFQPSDMAKLALLLALAHYGAYCQRLMRTVRWGLCWPALMVASVAGLVFVEPDWGTAMLLVAVSVVVLLVAGVRWLHLAPPLLLGVAALAGVVVLNPLRSDRVNVRTNRFYSWLHLEETRRGAGFQAWLSRAALTSGGPTGVGLNQSRHKDTLPEDQTDFIFAIIGEEFGFAGAAAVVVVYVALFVGGMLAAGRAPDTFGQLLGTGISFLLGTQALINIGVVSSALPNKGLALPYISYGGSNLMMMLICAGVLVSLACARPAGLNVAAVTPPGGDLPST